MPTTARPRRSLSRLSRRSCASGQAHAVWLGGELGGLLVQDTQPLTLYGASPCDANNALEKQRHV